MLLSIEWFFHEAQIQLSIYSNLCSMPVCESVFVAWRLAVQHHYQRREPANCTVVNNIKAGVSAWQSWFKVRKYEMANDNNCLQRYVLLLDTHFSRIMLICCVDVSIPMLAPHVACCCTHGRKTTKLNVIRSFWFRCCQIQHHHHFVRFSVPFQFRCHSKKKMHDILHGKFARRISSNNCAPNSHGAWSLRNRILFRLSRSSIN